MTQRKGSRSADNGERFERKKPWISWLLGATSSVVIIAGLWGVLAVLFDFNITLPGGFKFEKGARDVEVVVFTQEQKERVLAGLFTPAEKQELLEFVRKASKSYATMERNDMTLGDLIKHTKSIPLHVVNLETLELNPVLMSMQEKINK